MILGASFVDVEFRSFDEFWNRAKEEARGIFKISKGQMTPHILVWDSGVGAGRLALIPLEMTEENESELAALLEMLRRDRLPYALMSEMETLPGRLIALTGHDGHLRHGAFALIVPGGQLAEWTSTLEAGGPFHNTKN